MITGEEAPFTGDQNLGPKTLPSFFNQNHADELDPTLTVLETVEQIQTRGSNMSARDVLGCFLFKGDDVFKKIGVLSGGRTFTGRSGPYARPPRKLPDSRRTYKPSRHAVAGHFCKRLLSITQAPSSSYPTTEIFSILSFKKRWNSAKVSIHVCLREISPTT